MTLEIVVYNIESALKAQEGRADRIELCDNPVKEEQPLLMAR